MLILKCKMCGGDLELIDGNSIAECQHCGSRQTLPNPDDEKKIRLFNQANKLRISLEFDRAASIYENIIAEFPEEAEGYWGLCLCNYGIEYVVDPATEERKPTCHRASFEKLTDDENFKNALDYADMLAKRQYTIEAREIDRINEEILSVSKNEKPYDVFICYKETDENNERTVDSIMAEKLYDMLTDKGYKVFFSRISLEDKTGMMYEPYIFAALNSAKIMLCIGTKYEHFHAVWVKNEWGRFLRLAAKDKSKFIFPCYKDCDPYIDLPQEFKALQAQDLGKVGAENDLIRGIEKILGKKQEEAPVQKQVVVNTATGATTETFLKRAKLALESADFSSVNKFCESALNMDPENADAYLYKLLSDLKITNTEELSKGTKEFTDNVNYQRAYRFGDAKRKEWLTFCVNSIIYNIATDVMVSAKASKDFEKAAEVFSRVSGFKNADKNRSECIYSSKQITYDEAKKLLDAAENSKEYEEVAKIFAGIRDFKDAAEQEQLALECKEKAQVAEEEQRKNDIYNEALKLKNKIENINNLVKAVKKFSQIRDYKDSEKQIKEIIPYGIDLCKKRMKKIIVASKRASKKKVFKFLTKLSIIIAALVFVPLVGSGFAHPLLLSGFFSALACFFAFLVLFIINSVLYSYNGDYEPYYLSAVKLSEFEYGKQYQIEVCEYKNKESKAISKSYFVSCLIAICIIVSSIFVASETKVILYNNAMNKGDYQQAYSIVEQMTGDKSIERAKDALLMLQKSQLESISEGDIIGFGVKIEDDATKGYDVQSVEWQVLEIVDGKALLLENKYNGHKETEFIGDTWKDSNIREYLNDDFYNCDYFTDEQRDLILLSEIETEIAAGSSEKYLTRDRIFILTADDAEKYFDWSQDRNFGDARYWNKSHEWYLRTPGEINDSGEITRCYVPRSGYGGIKYNEIPGDGVVIRAAMWIDISGVE